MSNRRAFTLIELLVVIAIIAILAAILFPVFAQAKLAAKKSADLSNVKQTSLAHVIYCGDNDDLYAGTPWNNDWYQHAFYGRDTDLGYNTKTIVSPSGGVITNWATATEPYMKSKDLMVSPLGVMGDSDGACWNPRVPGQAKTNYFMNGLLQFASQNSIDSTADTVMFRGHRQFLRAAWTIPFYYGKDADGNAQWGNQTWNGYEADYIERTANNGENVGWADGHANYKKVGVLTFRNFGFTNRANPDAVAPQALRLYRGSPRTDFPVAD